MIKASEVRAIAEKKQEQVSLLAANKQIKQYESAIVNASNEGRFVLGAGMLYALTVQTLRAAGYKVTPVEDTGGMNSIDYEISW